MKVLAVAGARPNFMKVAPILRELSARGHEATLVHTGQHYDAQMSDTFFQELKLPAPNFHLGVGGGSHAQQTARIMEGFEPVLLDVRPNWLVVVGDVNSTIATALVAAKLREQLRCRICHVEAGLRSNDWRMPEEVNRVLTDRLSDLLLTPSEDAHQNLAAEGIPANSVVFVGNVMIDTLYAQLAKARAHNMAGRLGVPINGYVLSTLHRPSNVDDPNALRIVLEALERVSKEIPVVLPLHPRTRQNAERFGLGDSLKCLMVIEPVGYNDMLSLTDGAAAVLTDSGGLQEEATALGVPCVTLRESTERPSTIAYGTNRLVPWPLAVEGVYRSFKEAVAEGRVAVGQKVPRGWDGRTSERIVAALEAR